MPPLVFDEIDSLLYKNHSELGNQYNLISSLINKFNKLWENNYLTALRECHYGSSSAVSNNKINMEI